MRGYQILKVAQRAHIPLDNIRIATISYDSIAYSGQEKLAATERELEIALEPEKIAREAYIILAKHCPDDRFSPKALDALAYAVERGGTIDRHKLPNEEKLSKTIKILLDKGFDRVEEAVQHLNNLQQWGIKLASPKTMETLSELKKEASSHER